MERMTGIEPAYSAWENRPGAVVLVVTCGRVGSVMTVVDRGRPGLVARSSHGPCSSRFDPFVCQRLAPLQPQVACRCTAKVAQPARCTSSVLRAARVSGLGGDLYTCCR